MYAIVEISGTQEKVEKGMKLKVPLLKEEEGKTVTFPNVLMIVEGTDKITVGAPYIAGMSVEAKVLGTGKTDKIRVGKANRRKRYRRVIGHRQDFTEIEITNVGK